MAQTNKMSRATKIASRTISLSEQDPILRLRQLCSQGLYSYKFIWDSFENGIMCQCLVYYQLNASSSSRKTIIHRSRFVDGTDIEFAERQLAAIVLDELGLGVVEEEEIEDVFGDSSKDNLQKLLHTGVKLAVSNFGHLISTSGTEEWGTTQSNS